MAASKYYFTEKLIKSISVDLARQIVERIALLEGETLDESWNGVVEATLEGMAAWVNSRPERLRMVLCGVFRGIQEMGRVTRVKPTLIRLLRLRGIINTDNEGMICKDINARPLPVIAAELFLRLPPPIWHEACALARHFAAPKSDWLTFGVIVYNHAEMDTSDTNLKKIRELICELIQSSEGRADEGWCNHYPSGEDDEDIFIVDMTDHLQDKKERTGHNRFEIMSHKEVFSVCFRYQRSLHELSIQAQGPRAYRKEMCEHFARQIWHGNAALEDVHPRYLLEHLWDCKAQLKVPDGSAIVRADIVGFELQDTLYENGHHAFHGPIEDDRISDFRTRFIRALNIPAERLLVAKVNVNFSFVDRFGERRDEEHYFRLDSSNRGLADEALRPFIQPLMVLNGFVPSQS